jgi:predicted nucleic acid-binding protein
MRVVLTEHELIFPAAVLAEFPRILTGKFKLPDADLSAALDFFADTPTVPKSRRVLPAPTIRDGADAWVLASAVSGLAEVAGDKDLLAVATEAPLPILTPREFYERRRTL